MIKKTKFIIVYSMITILVTGCWNKSDINERSIVVAVGLDKTENNKIEVTLQIAKIKENEGNSRSGNSENLAWTNSYKGDTVFEAIRNQLKVVNRKPFFGHVKLMVIGEELAKEGIIETVNFFERDHELKLTPYVLISKGISAKKVLKAKSDLEDLSAIHIETIIKNSEANSKINKTLFIDMLRAMNRPGQDPLLGVIKPNNKENIKKVSNLEAEGSAILKNHKLVGWLSGKETRAYLMMNNKVKDTIINVNDPIEKEKKVSIEIFKLKGSRKVINGKKDIKIIIDIDANGNIGGQQSPYDLSNEKMLKKLEIEVENKIKKEIGELINIAQKKYNSDFLGFNKLVHKRYSHYWNTIEKNWNEEFSKINTEVNVKVKIKRTGLVTSPTTPK